MRSRALSLAALALLVLCGWTPAGVRPAAAQALDAGKPPAQIFNGTCSACHRSPRGLVRSVSPGSLPGFLRQHYTTGNDMAGTMATYVLGNGGTDRVAEPTPKREPKQKAKSDTPEVAARTPEAKDQSRAAKQQKAGKKGPETAAKDAPAAGDQDKAEAAKAEAAKTDAATTDAAKTEPVVDAAKTETAASDCKVEEPVKQAPATATEDKPGIAMPPTPPRQPTSLLTLPGFPAPVPEPEPEPIATAAASPGCDSPASTTAAAKRAEEPLREAAKETPTEAAEEAPKDQPTATTAPTVAEAARETAKETANETARTEPLRPAVAEAPPPPLDIMQEEVHAPRPARAFQQKKRVP